MKKGIKILVILSVLSIMFWPQASFAEAPINTLYQRDNAISEGYGQNHRLDGDFDGDGIKDFVISATRWSTQTGRVYIYFGGSSLSANPDVTIAGEGIYNKFGDGMDVGDFNNDGIEDLAVGAVQYNNQSLGRAYVFYGRSRANWASITSASQANVKVTGEPGSLGYLGNKVALGDVNGDGFDDLLIGAERFGINGDEHEGRAYLVFGKDSSSIDINAAAADVIIINDFGVDYTALGADVDIGDIGGDSHPDILISQDDWLGGGVDCHAIAIWGSDSLSGTINASASNLIITPDGPGFELFSYPVRAADVNNDGRKDLIAGADHFGVGGGGARMSVFFGGPSLTGSIGTSSADIVIIGENLASSDVFSMAITTGDINNDGIDDIITSNYYGSPSNLYIFFGGSSLLTKTSASEADYIIEPPSGFYYMGWWTSAGDVNGDGWDELCSSAPSISGGPTGAFIFSLSHIPPTVTLNGPTINYTDNQAEVNFSGSATDPDGGNIARVQYSIDGDSWQNTSPTDGSFSSSNEDYYFDVSGLPAGNHSVRVRATDTENATTAEANYAVSTFIVIGILPESGQSLINYINNLLL